MNKYENYHGDKRFYEILENLAKLHSEKNRQYATKENPLGNFYRTAELCSKLFKYSIKNKPLAMALSYMAKQVDGVYEIVGESKENTVDSLKDKLQDVAIYSILSMILIDDYEERENEKLLNIGVNKK